MDDVGYIASKRDANLKRRLQRELDAAGVGRPAAAELRAGETPEAVPAPRFVQLGDHIVNLYCIEHIEIIRREGNDRDLKPKIILHLVSGLEIEIEAYHESALTDFLRPEGA